MTEPQTGASRSKEKARQKTRPRFRGQPPQPLPEQRRPDEPDQQAGQALTQVPAEQERDWALAAHVGSFLAAYVGLGFVCPLVVLLAKGKQSAFVRQHAVESLNFQLTALGALLVAGVLALVYIGLVLLPFIAMVYLVLVIMAGMAAYRGEAYRYPVAIRLVT